MSQDSTKSKSDTFKFELSNRPRKCFRVLDSMDKKSCSNSQTTSSLDTIRSDQNKTEAWRTLSAEGELMDEEGNFLWDFPSPKPLPFTTTPKRTERDSTGNVVVIPGYICWKNAKGEIHRPEHEGPAVIYEDGTREYWKNGQLNRTSGFPAVLNLKNDLQYYEAGELHNNLPWPAVVHGDGQLREWYDEGNFLFDDQNPTDIDENGNYFWETCGQDPQTKEFRNLLHRNNDAPAVILSEGRLQWCQNDVFHRENKPAHICKCGTQMWFIHGLKHRNGMLPAHVQLNDGLVFWYRNGILQFGNLHPTGVFSDDTLVWKNEKKQLHREWQPAVINIVTRTFLSYKNGVFCSYGDFPSYIKGAEFRWHDENGKLHRPDDKPAIIEANGNLHWYRHGVLWRIKGLPVKVVRAETKISREDLMRYYAF
jgi:hypothetical protein